MDHVPSLELLEATHSFPGTYVLKAIGSPDNDFVARVVAAAREVLNCDADPPHSLRQSGGGRHVAVTLELHVQTASQVLEVYRCLRPITGLVVLL